MHSALFERPANAFIYKELIKFYTTGFYELMACNLLVNIIQ